MCVTWTTSAWRAHARAHTHTRPIFGIDVGGHYHIARSPIVEIRRRICIGFAFGQESRSPHFVLRRRMALASPPPRLPKGGTGVSWLPRHAPRLEFRQLGPRRIAGCTGSIYSAA